MYTRTRRHGKWEKRRALDSLRYRSLPSFFLSRPFEQPFTPLGVFFSNQVTIFSTSFLTHTHTHRLCRLPAAFRFDRKTMENCTPLEFFTFFACESALESPSISPVTMLYHVNTVCAFYVVSIDCRFLLLDNIKSPCLMTACLWSR